MFCTCVANCHYWVSSVWSKMNIFDCIRNYSFLCNFCIFSIATKKWVISTAAKNMYFKFNWPNHPNSKSLQIHAHNMDPFRMSTISRSVFFYDWSVTGFYMKHNTDLKWIKPFHATAVFLYPSKFQKNSGFLITRYNSRVNPFVPNAPFLYSLVFWCFQVVEKGCIGNEWVYPF